MIMHDTPQTFTLEGEEYSVESIYGHFPIQFHPESPEEACQIFDYLTHYNYEPHSGYYYYEHKLTDNMIDWIERNSLKLEVDISFCEPAGSRDELFLGAVLFNSEETAMAFKIGW